MKWDRQSTVHDGEQDPQDSSNAEENENEESEPRSRPRLCSRGSEMSDFEAWNEARMMSSDSEFEHNLG